MCVCGFLLITKVLDFEILGFFFLELCNADVISHSRSLFFHAIFVAFEVSAASSDSEQTRKPCIIFLSSLSLFPPSPCQEAIRFFSLSNPPRHNFSSLSRVVLLQNTSHFSSLSSSWETKTRLLFHSHDSGVLLGLKVGPQVGQSVTLKVGMTNTNVQRAIDTK